MPHGNNLNFPEYMFALYLLYTLGDNFGMKELSITRELMHLVLKKCVKAPSYNSLNYLHFASVSMETENLGLFLLQSFDQTMSFQSLERSYSTTG